MLDDLQMIAGAIKAARVKAKAFDLRAGTVDCPKCGGSIQFVIRSNPLAHPDAPTVWGACESTPDCLRWAM
jgi:hypothetical protein